MLRSYLSEEDALQARVYFCQVTLPLQTLGNRATFPSSCMVCHEFLECWRISM